MVSEFGLKKKSFSVSEEEEEDDLHSVNCKPIALVRSPEVRRFLMTNQKFLVDGAPRPVVLCLMMMMALGPWLQSLSGRWSTDAMHKNQEDFAT